MRNLDIKRLDHHGLVMGVIKDIKLIETIDQAVGLYSDEKLSVGQRVAGMVINGLGFTDQPLSLVSEFYKDIPVDALFGEGITSDDFDRFSLSRALDRLDNYGVESLFSNVAATACQLLSATV
jgi:transposase